MPTPVKNDPHVGEFIRLFNAEEFFEAHDVLEELWQVYPGEDRKFYQGLIQVAVALEHRKRGNLRGARGVLSSARRNLDPYLPTYEGWEATALLESAAAHIESPDDHPAPRLPPLEE